MEIVNRVGIRENGVVWEFINEVALEDFLWDNLDSLFSFTPLQRQLNINGQICDVLALDRGGGLIILELKNTEDRYILQQLTRYYDAVIKAKPLADWVNYQQQVRLIAIKPQFHRDNYTDRQYSQLYFEFWQFSIVENHRSLFFELINSDSQETKQVEIPYKSREENHDLPPLPATLSKILPKYPLEQQAEVLRIREKILTFDKRIQEIFTAGSIKYGNGNTKSSKFCAEFYIDKGEILIFLWLPLKNGTSEKMLGRARLWTDWQGKTLVEGYASSGVGTKINAHKRVVDSLAKRLSRKDDKYGNFMGFHTDRKTVKRYLNMSNSVADKIDESNLVTVITPEEIDLLSAVMPMKEQIEKQSFWWDVDIQAVYKSLDYFVDMALKRWSSRI